MNELLLAVLVASLLGSVHCAGMCGAFVALAVSPAPASAPQPLTICGRTARGFAAQHALLQGAYHAGRLATYLALGSAAGSVGAALDLGGSLVGVQRAAGFAAAAMMIGLGVLALARAAGVSAGPRRAPRWLERAAGAAHARASRLPALWRSAAIGLLTTLLPCGWLYAFVITAAGTGGAPAGAAVMAVFWLGTLPVLVAFGVAVRSLTAPLARRLPLVTALLLIGLGTLTLTHRLRPATAGQAQGAAFADDPGAVVRAVRALPEQTPPCCNDSH